MQNKVNGKRSYNKIFDEKTAEEFVQKLGKESISLQDLQNVRHILGKVTKTAENSSFFFPSFKLNFEQVTAQLNSSTAEVLHEVQKVRECAVSLLHSNKCVKSKRRRTSGKDRNDMDPAVAHLQSMDSDLTRDSTSSHEILMPTNLRRWMQPHCYVCKKKFLEKPPHTFYKSMCVSCGNYNLLKRNQTSDLSGKVALVTGGRIKIGFEIVLKLLRSNCKLVIVTTRFPVNAAKAFASHPDWKEEWKERIHIYSLDMRFLGSVEAFCKFIKRKYTRLDILIQNAAQTIRRPSAYYRELVEKEKLGSFSNNNEEWEALLQSWDPYCLTKEHVTANGSIAAVNDASLSALLPSSKEISDSKHFDIQKISTHTSQLFFHPEEMHYAANPFTADQHFPSGRKDQDGQQLDLRAENTWTMQLDKVHSVELAEVTLVNYLAPYVILKNLTEMLKPAKVNNEHFADYSHVVMVSAMEGKFNCSKTTCHPHTNGAKAALNMLVRTSGKYYKDMGIILNAVDTGWVTDELPVPSRERGFTPPLDCIDGAARVLDPIFATKMDKRTPSVWGKFLKDYKVVDW